MREEGQTLDRIDAIRARLEIDVVATRISLRTPEKIPGNIFVNAHPLQVEAREEGRKQLSGFARQAKWFALHLSNPERIVRVSISAKNSTSGCVSILKAASSALE